MGKVFYFLAAVLFFLPCLGHAEDCMDCGDSGWGEMDVTCPDPIHVKNDFKLCLKDLPEANVNDSTDINEFREGYIKLHEMNVHETSVPDSIKAFIYHQWAVDMQGQIYLLNQPG